LDSNGNPLTGWQTIEGSIYHFSPESGAMTTGWLETDEGRFFLSDSGTMHTGWLETDEGRFFLSDSGTMHTGWLETDEGRFFLSDSGAMHTGWLETDEGRFFLSDSGTMHTGWLETDEGRFFLNDSGAMHTGWLETDEGRFYLEDSGLLHIGWLELDGDRYYFREDGRMAVGKVTIDGTNRFFASTGKYVVVVNPWNPVPEDYELTLVEVEGLQVSVECQDALIALLEACKSSGQWYTLDSTYRDITVQTWLWDNRYNNYIQSGYSPEEAHRLTGQIVAYPGTSEHHLGTAVDIVGTDAFYAWIAEHSWEYGFHRRYPEDKIDSTGIIYEPWHFRYLGKELAKELYELDMTVEEYMDMLTKEE